MKSCVEQSDRNRASVLNQNMQQSMRHTNAHMNNNQQMGMSMSRMRASTLMAPKANSIQCEIQVSNCNIESEDDLTKISYEIIVQTSDQIEWVVERSLKDIMEFQAQLKNQYKQFDFQGKNISIQLTPPSQDGQFYFENILKYEIQVFMEKTQKIPFIREGKISKE